MEAQQQTLIRTPREEKSDGSFTRQRPLEPPHPHTAKENPVRLNPFNPPDSNPPVVLAVTPPRTGERTLLGVENLLQSIAVPEPFSLELGGDADGVTLLVRCHDDQVVRGQIAAHYPQARVEEVPEAEDPLRLGEGEQAWGLTLRSSGPEYVPLRTFRDDDLLDPGSDPLIALLGALSALRPGERIVARLLLRSLGPDWSQAHQELAYRPTVQHPGHPPSPAAPGGKSGGPEPLALAVLAVVGLVAFKGWDWVQSGEPLKAALLGLGVLGASIAGLWVWNRWKGGGKRVHDPALIKEKVSRAAFDAELQVTAILPPGAYGRARELLGRVAAAYRHYDHPAGARFKAGRVQATVPDPSQLAPAASGFFGARSVLGVREVASLWHPLGAADETPLVERSGARVLLPSAGSTEGGARVGRTTSPTPAEIRFPDDLVRRHHLYVARTRMGKSTLMRHLVAHKLREKAEGRDGDAIVVVDPHADLVAGILKDVPASLVDRVRFVDLSSEERFPGINILDTRVFSDRDRTADSVVRIARGLWDQWGPRMQSILEHTAKTLHEANVHPSVAADEQHTILDGLRLLSEERFRSDVLKRVSDGYLLDWWARDFGRWRREYQADAVAPVQTRLAYYASSKRARAILGQPRSTIDLRRTILDGGILLVSTAQGAAGRDVAALVGASILNLVDGVIREQERLPLAQRRGALVVVDEMQTMPGVDYESMLSDLGKYGASLVLATQSLAKLADLSPTMQDTLLANVGCLAVFQVAGADARQLVWELGRDRVSEEDIVSLPAHHCYVRATVGNERKPAFSMEVLRPDLGDPGCVNRIREEAAGYTTAIGDIEERAAKARERIDRYRKGLEALADGAEAPPSPQSGDPGPGNSERRGQHSKRRPRGGDAGSPEAASEDDA